MKIIELLSCGVENAVKTSDLARMVGLPERVIRRMIHNERLAGAPILSTTSDGYFLPGNNNEAFRCVRSLRNRGNEILRAADAIEKAAGDNGTRY